MSQSQNPRKENDKDKTDRSNQQTPNRPYQKTPERSNEPGRTDKKDIFK